MSKNRLRHRLKSKLPFIIRNPMKIILLELRRKWNVYNHIEKGERISLGNNFRFDRSHPYTVSIDRDSHVDSYNIWNADLGNISIGANCWVGVHNILMGPLQIGNDFSTGPHVKILGPRHAAFQYENQDRSETVIGNNVAITTGAILLYGVHIGDNAIIGPGSVVNKDVKPGAYVFGTPARDLTKLVNFDNRSVSSLDSNHA